MHTLIPLIISIITTAQANDLPPDCQSVQRIYSSLGGTESKESACCKVPGVHCSGENVVEIRWFNRSLTGSIPLEISQLKNLEILGISTNRLRGNMPPELGQLTKLKTLILKGNGLSGPIPIELENLTGLEELKIDVENYCGVIPQNFIKFTRKTVGDCPESIQEKSIGRNKVQHHEPPEEVSVQDIHHGFSQTSANHQEAQVVSTSLHQETQQVTQGIQAPQPSQTQTTSQDSQDDKAEYELIKPSVSRYEIDFQQNNQTLQQDPLDDYSTGNLTQVKYSYGFGETETSSSEVIISSLFVVSMIMTLLF